MTNFAMNMDYELESWLQNWIVKVFIKTASESRPMYILDTGSWSRITVTHPGQELCLYPDMLRACLWKSWSL
jgi:hypothetical protein